MSKNLFEDIKINVKIKLAALWMAVNLLYLYVDIYSFYRPGMIKNVIAGEVAGFQINQIWLLTVILLMIFPTIMVFLSLALKAKVNRLINIIVGLFEIVFVIGPAIGEKWFYYIFASIVEVIILFLIVWSAWRWPRENQS